MFEEICSLPFIRGLSSGKLSREAFTFYQDQDALYLKEYSRALATLSSRAVDSDSQVAWAMGAAGCIAVESELHREWLGEGFESAGPSGVTQAYTDFLNTKTALCDYVVGVAAVLPCFWLYAELGEILASHNRPDHPFHEWLKTYSDEEFTASASAAIERMEKAFEEASEPQRAEAARAYLMACYHELWFFDQAMRAGG